MTVQSGDVAFESYRHAIDVTLLAIQLAERATAPQPSATQFVDRSQNPLRPRTFDQVVGQTAAKELLKMAVAAALERGQPLDNTLLIGQSGTGKSTLAHVVGEEMGVRVLQVAAPVSYDTLLTFREQLSDGDILFIDEIHLQALQERRGKESITSPEVLYQILEDHVIVTPLGPLPYPKITVMGATTDPGRLPEAFLNRFPLRPRLVEYTNADLSVIAVRNALALGMTVQPPGAVAIAIASAGVPRIVNNLVRNARLFSTVLSQHTVRKVREANGIAADGLDALQQQLLHFLLTRGAQTTRNGVVYQCSLASLATALGLSRDVKAIVLYVEPLLVKRGLIQVTPQGRRLTDAGIARAKKVRMP